MAISFNPEEQSKGDIYVSVADYERYLHEYKSAYSRYHSGNVPTLEDYIKVRLAEENKDGN